MIIPTKMSFPYFFSFALWFLRYKEKRITTSDWKKILIQASSFYLAENWWNTKFNWKICSLNLWITLVKRLSSLSFEETWCFMWPIRFCKLSYWLVLDIFRTILTWTTLVIGMHVVSMKGCVFYNWKLRDCSDTINFDYWGPQAKRFL
jgi:hypothetical protein